MDRLGERRHGLIPKPSDIARPKLVDDETLRWQHRVGDGDPSVTVLIGSGSYESAESLRQQIDAGLTVHRHQRVDINEQRDSLGGTICGAGDRQAAVAGTAQHDVVEIFELEHRNDVVDVCAEPDPWTQMAALTHPCQRRSEHHMPTPTQQLRDRRPFPASAETTMNDHEDRHT